MAVPEELHLKEEPQANAFQKRGVFAHPRFERHTMQDAPIGKQNYWSRLRRLLN